MEAKDTVVKLGKVLTNDDWDEGGGYMSEPVGEALLKQAEISFRAGYKEGVEDQTIEVEKAYRLGIREVAEWIKANAIFAYDNDREAWQAKLKEWGL